jgi:hypothetical protein
MFSRSGDISNNVWGHVITQAVIRRFPLWRRGFSPKPDHVGFVVDKVALGQAFSEYFGFYFCHSANCSILINHRIIDAT